jgi:hypothetical protein
MESHAEAADTAEHELTLVAGAVRLVATGGAPRVVVVGLRGGAAVYVQARAAATRAGVLVSIQPWESGEAADLVVERDG